MRAFLKTAIAFVIAFSAAYLPFLLGGVTLGLYPGYRVYEYVWKDARFCTSCHVHDYASFSWKGSAHGTLTTCHDCHHQPLHAYMWEPVALVLYHPKFPKDLKHTPHVAQDLCESCHVSGHGDSSTITGPLAAHDIEKIPKVDRMYLHQIHLSAQTNQPLYHEIPVNLSLNGARAEMLASAVPQAMNQKRSITCTDCHGGPSNRAHNFAAVDISCVRCHENQHHAKAGSQFGCRSCHFQEFILPARSGERR